MCSKRLFVACLFHKPYVFRTRLRKHLFSFTSRVQAIAIGQALVDGRWLECVSHHDQLFRDEYALYRPLQVKGLGKLWYLLSLAAR